MWREECGEGMRGRNEGEELGFSDGKIFGGGGEKYMGICVGGAEIFL